MVLQRVQIDIYKLVYCPEETQGKLRTYPKVMKDIQQILFDVNSTAECKEMLFEGASFERQVFEITSLGILVASHGAGNANIIFMKRGRVFVEVIAFGLASDFRRLSRHAGIVYRSVVALPDEEGVLLCATHILKHDYSFSFEWRRCVALRTKCRTVPFR